ncbi:hypothetical protein UFOVP510_41 [uncultured Caudovirales phage]|uniref:Uncharacterized protein n=1 Tax=uncultured Caudovirales phage TaxID=2100421 RepID=A0A6J5MRF4_9CAUD|nr:hypothetical protein UFOVP510_41 [uncultured Caudovirales phage]
MSVLSVVLGLDAKKFKSGMAGAASYAQSYGAAIRGSLMSALGPIAIALETINLMREGFNEAAQVADLSERYGVTADALQRLAFVGKKAGIEMGEIAKLMKQLNKAIAEASIDPKKAEMLKKMGIDMEALANGTLSATDAFFQISAGLDGASNKGEVLLALYDLLGRSGETMATLLGKSDEELRALFASAVVMSDEMINQADAMDDAFNTASAGAKKVGMWLVLLVGVIGGILFMAIQEIALRFNQLFTGFVYGVRGMIWAWMKFKGFFGFDTTETEQTLAGMDAIIAKAERVSQRIKDEQGKTANAVDNMGRAMIGMEPNSSGAKKKTDKKGRDIEGLTQEKKAGKDKAIVASAIQAVGGGGLVAGPNLVQQQVDIAKKQLDAQNLTNQILEYYGVNKDSPPMTTGGYPGHPGDYL